MDNVQKGGSYINILSRTDSVTSHTKVGYVNYITTMCIRIGYRIYSL
jgi:hypothetical protein